MPVRKTIDDGGVPVHVWTDDVEAEALKQLVNVSRLPFVFRHVAAMPDVHAGIGATVGAVIPTKGAIIPGGRRRRHRLRHERGAPLAHGRPICPTSSAACAARSSSAVPVGFDQHDATRCARPRGASRSRARLDRIADKHPAARADAEALRRDLGAAARHARRRQPLHRAVPRRGGPRLGDAALRQPRHRQRDRPLFHRAGARALDCSRTCACPTATSPTSRGHAALRRLRRSGRLGAGLRAPRTGAR